MTTRDRNCIIARELEPVPIKMLRLLVVAAVGAVPMLVLGLLFEVAPRAAVRAGTWIVERSGA